MSAVPAFAPSAAIETPVAGETVAPAPKGEIKALTGLRGIAALYVVIFHVNGHYRFFPTFQPFIRHGYMAVDLFFILSGFVMAMTYAGMFSDGFSIKTFKQFLLLRLARIYPLFALMTLLTAVLIGTVMTKVSTVPDLPKGLIYNFALIQAWGLSNSIVPPSWSISTEWTAYLLFPLSLWGALKVPRRWTLVGLVLSFGVLAAIAYGPQWIAKQPLAYRHGPLDIASSYAIGTSLRCLASFFIGLVAYRFREHIPSRASLVLLGLTIVLLCFKGSDLFLVAVFALLIMALSHDEGPVARWLHTPWVYWLGLVSYALYLIHDLVLRIVFKMLPGWGVHGLLPEAWVAVALVVSIGLAGLSHYAFEKPSRRWFRKFLVGNYQTGSASAPIKAS
ncbi:acyltransferase family protein [Asticcacaulis solisilvae]|uniref:acyltransferase family protein n=1 Tax=Asticcacaulis solisilvae TaxID=1217274 RepID=UPI003FD7A7F9